MGSFLFTMYATYSLSLWYGGKLIADDQEGKMNGFRDICPNLTTIENDYGKLNIFSICRNDYYNFSSSDCVGIDIVFLNIFSVMML